MKRRTVTPAGVVVPVSIDIDLRQEHPQMPEWPFLPDRQLVRSVTVGEVKWTAVDEDGNAFDWQVEGQLQGSYKIRLATPREVLLARLVRAGNDYPEGTL